MADQDDNYRPVDTLANTASSTMQMGLLGAVLAGSQNALRKQNVGTMGIFTRSGGLIAAFGTKSSYPRSLEVGDC